MLVAERHREIVNIVGQEKSLRVVELARMFQVTEETIRRDLEKLESEGKLIRSHGGAVSNKSMERELPYTEREIRYMQEKISIAREAVSRVEENDVILLDASTTAWQMAHLLPDKRMTVLTNAMKVALELAERSKIKVIFTGGTLSAPSLSFIGPLAEKTLQEYHVNKLFFSCKGVDVDRGLSDSNESHALLKRSMMTIADQSYLLADHSKFGVKALTMFSPLKDMHEIITDIKLDPAIYEQITNLNIKVSRV